MAAACVTNPIDVIKTRLQLQGELGKKLANNTTTSGGTPGASGGAHTNLPGGGEKHYNGFVRGTLRIVMDEGIAGLYKGLGPSVLREATYSTLRMGGYDVIKNALGAHDPKNTPFWKKVVAGATSGAVGAAIANPTDLIKVRMQAQGKASAHAHKYKNTLDAFKQVYKNEGLKGLYKGVSPNSQRAALLTASQLASYDHVKHFLLNSGVLKRDGIPTHFWSSFFAGFIAAAMTSPFDVVKTRIMNQPVGPDGRGALYKSTRDCFAQTIKSEGLFGLYKGFIPNWMRIGPHTIVTFIVYEQLRRLGGLRPI